MGNCAADFGGAVGASIRGEMVMGNVLLGRQYFAEKQGETEQYLFFRFAAGDIAPLKYAAVGEDNARAILLWLDENAAPHAPAKLPEEIANP